MTLNLYAFFHLNLMFSSVEEEQRAHIVERCYWPLLRLARNHRLPLGIEAPACTLEFIQAIDASWISELRELIHHGPCEFIGSGYAQLIGPLVPAAVNRANLRIGMRSYQSILGLQPTIALVNEQAYSAGIVPLYREAGYKALIMEWNNPARSHPEWDPEWRYHPQQAIGPDGGSIGLIWNKSIAFQKFQRYAHNELELEDYITYIRGHLSSGPRCFPLYGNDAEIFDFRPGRFMTEAPLQTGEWERLESLVEALGADPAFSLIPPSAVLEQSDSPHAGHPLRLESAEQLIPVKKQNKYNVVRWALTGRDDFAINTRCYGLYQRLSASPHASDTDWKELCFLWSSDFRTHITSRRWNAYQQRLAAFEERWPVDVAADVFPDAPSSKDSPVTPNWNLEGPWLTASTDHIEVRFNCRRGLAVEHFIDRRFSTKPLFGTLHHGRFDDISWGADYYSGHLVFQSPGSHQITDLEHAEPTVRSEDSCLQISASIPTPLGAIKKTWTIDSAHHTLKLSIQLQWPEAGLGCLRIVPLTLFAEAFDTETLQFSASNGGEQQQFLSLGHQAIDHGKSVSFLVSAHQGLGLTDGIVQLGDRTKVILMRFNPAEAALIGQIQHLPVDQSWFTRLFLSAQELDDTAKVHNLGLEVSICFCVICGSRIDNPDS
jgi:hypothetical protein